MQYFIIFSCTIVTIFFCIIPPWTFAQLEDIEEDFTTETKITIKLIREIQFQVNEQKNILMNSIQTQHDEIENLNRNIVEERINISTSLTQQKEQIDILQQNINQGLTIKGNSVDSTHDFAGINKTLSEVNFFLKEEMQKLKIQIIEERNTFIKSLTKQDEEIDVIKRNLVELISTIDLKFEDDEDKGPVSRSNTTDIWEAVSKDLLPAVKYYYKRDPGIINKKDSNYFNFTPLLYSARDGFFDIVKFLIAKGADIHSIDTYFEATPLLFASLRGHLRIINYLLNKGDNINVQNKDKATPLHLAIYEDQLDAVKLLISRGAELRIRNRNNQNPLEYAQSLGDRHRIVTYLLPFYKEEEY